MSFYEQNFDTTCHELYGEFGLWSVLFSVALHFGQAPVDRLGTLLVLG